VVSAGQDARGFRPVGLRDEELVSPKMIWRIALHRNAEHLENRAVEFPIGFEVVDHQLNMVDEPSTMKFHVRRST
jgi:hypothetical protein